MVRLNKHLAACGVCSRREADLWIEQGRVKVNGVTAKVGAQIVGNEKITVSGKLISDPNKKVVLAYHKPVGVTCTEKDNHAKSIVTRVLNYPVRVTYAGRLGKDSCGLLIMTNDGDLIQHMMKGSNFHEKEYLVKVNKEIDDAFIHSMSVGVYLEELDQTTRPCLLEKVGKYSFRIILTQGLNRQIRRMCETLGYKVVSLKRERVVNIELGNLGEGEYREIVGEELKTLYQLCNMKNRV